MSDRKIQQRRLAITYISEIRIETATQSRDSMNIIIMLKQFNIAI